MRVSRSHRNAPAIVPGVSFLEHPILHFQGESYSDSLGGLPPPKVLRLAASLRKYSLPRLAVTLPPLRPSKAAGVFACWIRSSVSAIAVPSNSRHRAVRFSGRGVVERIRSVSASSLLSVASWFLLDAILSR
jgi:hypothetical protein